MHWNRSQMAESNGNIETYAQPEPSGTGQWQLDNRKGFVTDFAGSRGQSHRPYKTQSIYTMYGTDMVSDLTIVYAGRLYLRASLPTTFGIFVVGKNRN